MEQLNDYKIAFRGLKSGDHEFEFAISDALFEAFENPEVKGGNGVARARRVCD